MEPQNPQQESVSRQRILIIDDDPLLAGMLQRMLALHQCLAMVAGGGQEGIEMARSLHPSVIICDESMPGMTGQEVVATLRSSPGTAHIPILLMSGHDDSELRKTADGFISKPFNAAGVLAALETLLHRPTADASRAPGKTQTKWPGKKSGPQA